MRYSAHLTECINLMLIARPATSLREISRAAGLAPGWCATFLQTGTGTVRNCDAVLDALRSILRADPISTDAGDRLSRLLDLDPLSEVA